MVRREYLLARKNLSNYDCFIKSWFAQERFLKSPFFSKCETVGVYHPILNEAQTFRIIYQLISSSKIVCLPAIIDEEISFFKYRPHQKLRQGRYKIMEPISTMDNMNCTLDTVITPGIAFDKFGNRVGYGKGYYDKFFQHVLKNDITIIGFGYDFQMISGQIKSNANDIKMNVLITDKRLFYT